MKLNAHQRLERLNLYGLVQSLSYVVRVRLALVLRQPKGLAKSLHAELTQLFAISGVWVRNVSDRHDTKRHIQELIRRILPGSRQLPPNWRGCLARLCLCDGTPEVSEAVSVPLSLPSNSVFRLQRLWFRRDPVRARSLQIKPQNEQNSGTLHSDEYRSGRSRS